MKIMRSNYDKARRCPNWSGPAMRGGSGDCPGGMLARWHEYRHPQWHIMRCPKCGTVVLPNVLRVLDPAWWSFHWYMHRKYGSN